MLATWGSSSGLNALLVSSSLSLNFSNGSYTLGGVPYAVASVPGYSFTRSSGGYAQNLDGSLTYFASGVPRITNKGYLSEEARTNLVTYSQDLTNAIWAKNAVTALANQTTAPDGTVTASSITETTANAQHYANYATSKAASAITYSTSVYVKPFGLTRNFKFSIFDGAGNGVDTIINPVTLATVSGPTYYGALPFTSVSVTTSTASNGFVRIGLIFTSNVTPAVGFGFQTAIGTTISFAGDASTGLYLWGAQLEAGAFATSYIPTTTAAATRAADGFYIAGNFMGSGPWTWLTDASINLSAISSPTVGGFRKDFSNYLVVYVNGTAGLVNLNLKVAGSDVWNVQKSAFASGSAKIAMSLIGGNVYQSINGGAAGSLGVNSVFAPTQVIIGWGGSANQLNGYTRSVTVWNNEFSTAQLQAITA